MSRGQRRGLVVVVVTALALPLVGCSGDEVDVAVGDAARVLDDPDVTRLAQQPDLTARLPVGELGLGWSDDADLLASVSDEEGRTPTASGDATLVAVAWDLDPTATGLRGAPGLAVVEGAVEHELALVSRGERTVLVAESERALRGSAVAAVADPTDVSLEVTFDGVTQVVGPAADDRDVPDVAQPLYDGLPVAEAAIDCRPSSAEPFCRADAAWLPWVADQGWAPAGQLWRVVRVEARDSGGAAATLTAALGGSSPVASEDLDSTEGVHQLLVFPAAAAAGPTPLEIEVATGDVTLSGRASLSPRPPTDR